MENKKKAKKPENGTLEYYLLENLPILLTFNYICFMALGGTTFYTGNNMSMALLNEHAPGLIELVPFLSIACGFGIMILFDYDLRRQSINNALAFSSKNWRKSKLGLKGFAFSIALLTLLRLGLSMSATLISAQFIADDITEDGDIEGLEKLQADKEATKVVRLEAHQRAVMEEKRAAQVRASNLVNDAIHSGPKDYQKLYKEKNAWFLAGGVIDGTPTPAIESYLKAVAKAKSDSHKILDNADATVSQLTLNYQELARMEASDENVNRIIKLKADQVEKANSTEWVRKVSLLAMDSLLGILAILSSIGIAIVAPFDREYVLFRKETTLSEIANEMFQSIWRLLKSIGVFIVGKMDEQSERVIETIGTVTIAGRIARFKRSEASEASGSYPSEVSGTAAEHGDNSGTDRSSRRTRQKRSRNRKTGTDKRSSQTDRKCKNCGTDISHKRSDAKHCGPDCRKAFWEKKARLN